MGKGLLYQFNKLCNEETPVAKEQMQSYKQPSFLSQSNVYVGLEATQEENPYVLILIIELTHEDITSHQYDNLYGNFEN